MSTSGRRSIYSLFVPLLAGLGLWDVKAGR